MALELKKVENKDDILRTIEQFDRGARITNIDTMFQDFLASKEQVMEISWRGSYANVNSAISTLRERAKKMQYHVRVVKVKDRLYLLNLELR